MISKYKTMVELFTDKNRWCKGTEAENKDGTAVFSRDRKAIRWCLLGGLDKVYKRGTNKYYAAREKLLFHIRKSNYTSIEEYNDIRVRRHEQILKLCERAGV